MLQAGSAVSQHLLCQSTELQLHLGTSSLQGTQLGLQLGDTPHTAKASPGITAEHPQHQRHSHTDCRRPHHLMLRDIHRGQYSTPLPLCEHFFICRPTAPKIPRK